VGGRRDRWHPVTGPDALVVVDKPAGLTSHDVVAHLRRIARTRKVGHAGTLDPAATGILVLGVGRATRLLAHLVLADKAYAATLRLGFSTVTDDAAGDVLTVHDAAGVTDDAVRAAARRFVGTIDQVPSSVSAVKVAGRRAYQRVRAGEAVVLRPRRVAVTRFDVVAVRRDGSNVDVDVLVDCSSGTYVRALARDLGTALGVGGHLTALRRTRVGSFDLDQASTLDDLAERAAAGHPIGIDLSTAVGSLFARHDVDAAAAARLSHGGRLPAAGLADVYAVFGPDGGVVALVRDDGNQARPVLVLRPG